MECLLVPFWFHQGILRKKKGRDQGKRETGSQLSCGLKKETKRRMRARERLKNGN